MVLRFFHHQNDLYKEYNLSYKLQSYLIFCSVFFFYIKNSCHATFSPLVVIFFVASLSFASKYIPANLQPCSQHFEKGFSIGSIHKEKNGLVSSIKELTYELQKNLRKHYKKVKTAQTSSLVSSGPSRNKFLVTSNQKNTNTVHGLA